MRWFLLALVLLVPSSAHARTWHVFEDGSGDAPTIQAAIDSSTSGDVVMVSPGTYYEHINFNGKDIHLVSSTGAASTTIDGNQEPGSVVTFENGETNAAILEGFTITGGTGSPRAPHRGGGIDCEFAYPTIRHNSIVDNQAIKPGLGHGWAGGLMFVSKRGSPAATIEGNTFANNHAENNGGGAWIEGTCVFRNNLVVANTTEGGDGGGIYVYGRTGTHITDNYFVGNSAGDHGGAIYVVNPPGAAPASADVLIERNVIVGNSSSTDGADDCSGGGIWVSGGALIRQNTIIFNTAQAVYQPPAGGICFRTGREETLISSNLIYANSDGGVVMWGESSEGTLLNNLIFGNGVETFFESATIHELVTWNANPALCIDDASSRGELGRGSPALSSPFGVIGAVRTASCVVAVEPTTWGQIKARYE